MKKVFLFFLMTFFLSQVASSATDEEFEQSLFVSLDPSTTSPSKGLAEPSENDLLELFNDEETALTEEDQGDPTDEDLQSLFNEEVPPEAEKLESEDPDLLELLQEDPVAKKQMNEDDVLAELLEEENFDPGPLNKEDLSDLKEVRRPVLKDSEKEDFKEFKQSLYSSENQMGINKKFTGWDLESIEVMDFVENEGLLYEDVLNREGFNSIEKIHKIEKTGSKKYLPPSPIIPRKKDFFNPENYFGILNKNSLLENLETKKKIRALKKIYVKARPIVVGGNTAYILDKEGNKKYKTRIQNIVSIQDEVDMKASPALFSEHVPRAQMEGDDTTFPLSHTFSLFAESIDPHYFETLFQTNGANASSIRGDYRFYYRWDWPIHLGVNVGAERGNWDPNTIALDWTGLYYGFSVNYPIFTFKNMSYEVSASFQKLALMNATVTGGGSIRFQGDSLSGNIQAVYKVPIGHLLIGLTFRETYLSVKESNVDLLQPDRKQSLESLGFKLGFRSTFNFWEGIF